MLTLLFHSVALPRPTLVIAVTSAIARHIHILNRHAQDRRQSHRAYRGRAALSRTEWHAHVRQGPKRPLALPGLV